MERGKKTSYEKGKHDVGNLVKLDATKCRVDFEDGSSANITISTETVPEILLKVLEKMPNNSKVGVDLTLDTTEKQILWVKPLVGTFDFKLVKFYAPEGSLPVIITKLGADGKPYGQFSAVVEVQKVTGSKGELWLGCRYNVQFYNKFMKNEDGNLVVAPTGASADFLNDFMDVTGAGEHKIPYSENPLPEIEKIALQENRTFSADVRKVVTKKGERYANVVMFNTYTPTLDFEMAEVEEAFPTPTETVHPVLVETDNI